MSYDELHIGKLFPIEDNPEEYAKRYLTQCRVKFDNNFKCYLDQLLDNFYDSFIMLNNKLYIKEDIECESPYTSWHKKCSDGSIDYVVGFYNGGCSLNEALEYEIQP